MTNGLLTHVPFLPEWVNELPLPVLVLSLTVFVPAVIIGLNVAQQLVTHLLICVFSKLKSVVAKG